MLRGTVTVGVLVAFIQYSLRFFRPIQDLERQVQHSASRDGRQRACLQAARYADRGRSDPTIPAAADRSGRIEFRNVWFTYQRSRPKKLSAHRRRRGRSEIADAQLGVEWILRDVSFTIEPDQTAAIVGHTGAGKTTIISLMMRFYDIQRGTSWSMASTCASRPSPHLRQHFGVVLQDPFLFTGTIAENIRLGSDWITDERHGARGR